MTNVKGSESKDLYGENGIEEDTKRIQIENIRLNIAINNRFKGSENIREDLKGSLLGWNELLEEEKDNLITLIEEYISEAYQQGKEEERERIKKLKIPKNVRMAGGTPESAVNAVLDYILNSKE